MRDIRVTLVRARWSFRDFDPSEALATAMVLKNGGWVRTRTLLKDRRSVYLVIVFGIDDVYVDGAVAALNAAGLPTAEVGAKPCA